MAIEKIGKLKRAPLAVVAAMLCFSMASADDMPFWGDGSPNTNRVASASQARAIGSFSSRDFCLDSIVLENFNSTKTRFIFIVY